MENTKPQLNFFHIIPGQIWGAEEHDYDKNSSSRGDALWTLVDYSVDHKGYEDRIIVHWYEKSEDTLHLFKKIEINGWLMHGFEDMEFELVDKDYSLFWKASLLDHLFLSGKIDMGKII